MNFEQLIKNNYQFLLKRLDPSHEFLGGLQQNEVIQRRIAYIKQQPTSCDKTDALLSALLEAPDDLQDPLMDDVTAALRSSGQDHIANLFRRVSDKVPMSDGHYRQLQIKMPELCKYMDPENGLLDQLISAEVVSRCEIERICFATGLNEMTRKLVEIFMKKSDDAFETLTEKLNKVGQTHVGYILTQNGNPPLRQKWRDKLILHRDKLITSIYSKGLVSVLMSKGVFTECDQQRVESRLIENEKIEKMLDLIARKSQSAFCSFIAALYETKQEHVAVELIGFEIAAEVEQIIDAARICKTDLEKELRKIMQDAFENDESMVKELNDVLDASETSFADVEEGSIIIKFRCKNGEALQRLYRSGKLDTLFTKTFCRPLASKGLKSIRLRIEECQFRHCSETLTALKLMTPEHREALESSSEWLSVNMKVNDDLLDKLSFYGRRRQAIESAATREEQVKTLLGIVSRQPDSAFMQLLNALRDTQQEQSALILSAPLLLDSREEETLPQQPEAALKKAKDSIDDERTTAIGNLQKSFSAVRQMCSKTVERTGGDDTNTTEPLQIDEPLKVTQVTGDCRLTAKQPILVSTSSQTSTKGNQPFAIENCSCLVDVIPSSERVYGVTSLNSHLYVLRADCVDVYTTSSDYTLLDRLSVAGLEGNEWNDLTSSMLHNSLYIADFAQRLVRAMELGGPVREWEVPDCPCGVSVTTDDDTLLVTCADVCQLLELRLDDGDWIRRVQLSPDIPRPWHAVKLTSGHYVVSHSCARGLRGQHRVCVVDSTGSILLSYGGESGSEAELLNWPCHVSLDEDGLVLVADSSNNRIVLLSPAVQLVRHLVGSLAHPRRLHLERATRRLYVGELAGRVVVVPLADCAPYHYPAVRLVQPSPG